MAKKPMPELPDTGRHYVEHTARARLASPGIERYGPRKGHGGKIALALLIGAAVIAAMLWLR
jgi:hypothetical protein